MNIAYPPERHPANGLFLAGPTPRESAVESWRPEALRILERINFSGLVYVPEEINKPYHQRFEHTYREQVEWEWRALDASTIIVFWVPRDLDKMPALTTNVEFGYWAAKDPSRVVLGFPKDAPKNDYLAVLAERVSIPVFHELETVLVAGAVLWKYITITRKET